QGNYLHRAGLLRRVLQRLNAGDEIVPLRLCRETIRAVRAGGTRIALVALRPLGAVRAGGARIALVALRASRSNIAGVALRRLRRNTVLDMRQTSRRQRSL